MLGLWYVFKLKKVAKSSFFRTSHNENIFVEEMGDLICAEIRMTSSSQDDEILAGLKFESMSRLECWSDCKLRIGCRIETFIDEYAGLEISTKKKVLGNVQAKLEAHFFLGFVTLTCY